MQQTCITTSRLRTLCRCSYPLHWKTTSSPEADAAPDRVNTRFKAAEEPTTGLGRCAMVSDTRKTLV